MKLGMRYASALATLC